MTSDQITLELRKFIGLPAREFVLHREPMLLLDRLIDIGHDFACCEWLEGRSAFADAGGNVPAYVGIEQMAQCIAVHAGARARIEGEPPPLGFLLGTRLFRSSIACFEPDLTYVAYCKELVRDSNGMGSFACELRLNGESIATANLTVVERPKT